MNFILGVPLILSFFGISIIHFYWAAGGKWGFDSVLPTNENDTRVLNPKTIDSVIVGFGILLFAIFYMIRISVITINLPDWLLLYSGWVIPTLFLIRVIGDFKFIGLFKKIKDSTFAKNDSKYFIPLCSFLSFCGFLLQWYKLTY